MEELRKRLVLQIKNQRPVTPTAAPLRGVSTDPDPYYQPNTLSQAGANENVLNQIRKWNLKYDGGKDAVMFLERLEELPSSYGVSQKQLLQALPELLKDKALLWYRNNKIVWNTWDQFHTDFISFYLPDLQDNLEDEIRNRKQRPREILRDYLINLQTLLRRHGGFSAQRQLEIIYRQMLPTYKTYIRKKDFTNLRELVQLALEYEQLQQENYPNSHPAPAQLQPRPPPLFSPTRPTSNIDTQHYAHSSNTSSAALNINSRYDRPHCCWRCGHKGHTRFNCRQPAHIFCSHCGKKDVLSKDCTCTKNFRSGEETRGDSNQRR